MKRLAIQLERDRLIAMESGNGARSHAFEVAWDPAQPAAGVAAVRERIGGARDVRLVVGLPFLSVARVQLPPVAPPDRQRMLALEADRYFTIESGDIAVALDRSGTFAFAADAGRIAAWVAAFSALGRVEAVEPVPPAVARVVAPTAQSRVVVEVAADEGMTGVVECEQGSLRAVRRLIRLNGELSGAAREVSGVRSHELALRSTLAAGELPMAEMLLPAGTAAALTRGRGRRVWLSAAAAVAALALFFAALGRYRDRTLATLQHAVAAAETEAAPALGARRRIAALADERATIAGVTRQRSDPMAVLAALTRALPADAVVASVRATGDEWEVQGTASHAAALVPTLAASPMFENVRFLAASNRFADAHGPSESFSIAFRARHR